MARKRHTVSFLRAQPSFVEFRVIPTLGLDERVKRNDGGFKTPKKLLTSRECDK